MSIKGTEIVEKSNALNEIRMNGMDLQELRFFSIYLAKINARDTNTRKVTFPLSDFQKIMEIGRMNIKHFQNVTNGLLCKVYNQPNEDGGYTGFTIFKRCRVFKNELEEWFVEIEASDDALPLMFNMRNRYFKYELWNALRLKSANQIAMYELLKQYENLGKLEISTKKLREKLDLIMEYPRWERFKTRVLDSCQQSLSEFTDIKFTYERGKTGTGGKWLTIVFYISQNKDYKDPLTLNQFISQQEICEINNEIIDIDLDEDDVYEAEEINFNNPNLVCYADICNNEFSESELQVLYDMIIKIIPNYSGTDRFDYFKSKLDELNLRSDRCEIKSRFAYLKKMISSDMERNNFYG